MYELVAARRVLFAWPEQRRLQNQLPDNVITRDATCTNFTPDSPPFFPFHPISSLSPPPDYSWNAISTPIFPQRRSKSSDKHRLEENSRTCINWQGEKSREENYYRSDALSLRSSLAVFLDFYFNSRRQRYRIGGNNRA